MTPYVVPTYPVVKHKLPGTERWAELAQLHSGGALWNNGTWVIRDIRGKTGQISNHARGVAMDLSFRRIEPAAWASTTAAANPSHSCKSA